MTWDALKEALDAEMLKASRRLEVMERIKGKSPDYIAGFFAGMDDQAMFTTAMLAPVIKDMQERNKSLRKT